MNFIVGVILYAALVFMFWQIIKAWQRRKAKKEEENGKQERKETVVRLPEQP